MTFDHRVQIANFGFRLTAGSNFARYLNAISAGGGGYFLVGQSKRFLELGLDMQYLRVHKTSDDQKGFAFVFPNHPIETFYPSLNIGYRAYGRRALFRF